MTIEEKLMKLGGELEQVKRRNSRMVLGMIACAAMAVVALVLPLIGGSVVRADKFMLVDGRGRERAAMAMDKDWGPGLFIFDEHGESRVDLYANEENGTGLIMHDENGEFSLWMSSTSDGSSLALLDKRGTMRADLGVADYGSRLSLSDERAMMRAALSSGKRGQGLALRNEDGDTLWQTP